MPILESRLAQRARRNPWIRPPAIAAYRAVDRIWPASQGPRVLANSMPKAGTHLLTSLLEGIPRMRFGAHVVSYLGKDGIGEDAEFEHLTRRLRLLRDSHYISGHLAYDPDVEAVIRQAGVTMVTIVRDPRAQVISWAHYLLNNRHVPGREWVLENYPDMESLLPALVMGIGEPFVYPYLPDLGERFRRYSGWIDSEASIVLRFEDLVGSRGGGSDEAQIAATQRILRHLGYDESQVAAADVAANVFSPNSATFRAGQIDSWREELPEDLVAEANRLCGDHLQRWGYQA